MCSCSGLPVTSAVPSPLHVERQPVGRFFSRNLTFKTTGRSWSSLYHGGEASRHRCCFRVFASQGRDFKREQQLKLSVLRFTLGIPGLDESYLPRWIGLAFGSLILLNHFLSSSPTPAQLRSEGLGLCLAAFSTTLPYIGEILEGKNQVDRSVLPEGNKQIFIMSENLLDSEKEDLAWATFVLLHNTNAISVQILPKGAASVLVQPVFGGTGSLIDGIAGTKGFILLVSSAKYAFNAKDKAWVTTISKKFEGMNAFVYVKLNTI
ncbi:hypothetical protein HPP92_001354 [Vanilla planifolia]|uniref:Uncharacterized protein n=1 Tax=Vanilla planifolia TaxID=51239 RepID=A0A835RTU1_VANPL|nr:hypothetical protein HPP92_001354 [Vanilla planifolia]